MALSDKFGNSNKSAVGNLGAFRVLKNTDLVKSQGNGNQLISNMWKARGGLPFRLPNNKSANIIFLTDVHWVPVHDLAIGERKGPTGRYPIIESFHSTSILGIDSNGNPIKSDRKCLFEKGLGRNPKLIVVAKVVDLTSFKTKDGVNVPWSVRTIAIPSSSPVLSQLAAASEITGKDMKYAMFNVARSGSDKSAKIGDSWTYKNHVTVDDLKSEGGLLEAADRIDFEAGYPILQDSDILNLLKMHRRICDKFSDTKNAILTYDEDAMNSLFGATTHVAPEAPASKPTLGLSSMKASKPSLDDLDDIPSGNPLMDLDDPSEGI